MTCLQTLVYGCEIMPRDRIPAMKRDVRSRNNTPTPHLRRPNEAALDLEFQTLRISPGMLEKLRGHANVSPSISKYVEDAEEEMDAVYEEENAQLDVRKLTRFRAGVDFILPDTISTFSPPQTNSAFDDPQVDTEETLEMSADEFEDEDNIFGKEESGIYTSGGTTDYGHKEFSRKRSGLLGPKATKLSIPDDLDNIHTVQYEDDEFGTIQPDALRPFKTTILQRKLVPNFHDEPQRDVSCTIPKSRSSMDVRLKTDLKQQSIKNKLERLPSFQKLPRDSDRQARQQYLEKLREREKAHDTRSRRRKPMGQIYLNGGSSVPRTDAQAQWDGLDSFHLELVPHEPPARQHVRDDTGNMYYDRVNQRWVNGDEDEELREMQAFADFKDLPCDDVNAFSSITGARKSRLKSQNARVLSASERHAQEALDALRLSSEQVRRFEEEEKRIERKTHQWFAPNEEFQIGKPRPVPEGDLWELYSILQ